MKRSKNDGWLSSRGWTRNKRPLPPDRKRQQHSRKNKNANPKTGFDLAPRVVQTIRSRSDADSRTHDSNLEVVQRSGAGYVEMAERWALCFLAGLVSGQRYQRRASVVEGQAPVRNRAGTYFDWPPILSIMTKPR